MKNAQWVLEFTTHVLANSINSVGSSDIFQRDGDNCLIWQSSWWYSAFTRAIDIAHIRGIKPSDINMNLSIKTDTQMYKRRYGDGKYRTHEAIMPGTRVTFEAVVSDHLSESNLRTILEQMGKFVGLSPYGYRLGYGKFRVITCKVEPSLVNETSQVAGTWSCTSQECTQ